MSAPAGLWVHSSFAEPVADPGTAPGDAPLVCLQVNAAWIPYICGCVMQLLQPAAWTASTAALPDLLGRVHDLIAAIGSADTCTSTEFQLTSDGELQYSIDGGATWSDVSGWATNFPLAVRANQAHTAMQSGDASPPIPQLNEAGTDWLWTPSP